MGCVQIRSLKGPKSMKQTLVSVIIFVVPMLFIKIFDVQFIAFCFVIAVPFPF